MRGIARVTCELAHRAGARQLLIKLSDARSCYCLRRGVCDLKQFLRARRHHTNMGIPLKYILVGFLVAILVFLAYLASYRTSVVPIQILPTAEFGGVSLIIEYATTTEARERGLSGRETVAQNQAMLFVFPRDGYYGFWMKDTLVPLDIFWLDSQGQVVSIKENVQPASYPDVFYPSAPARYVLETISGFAREHLVATGTSLLLKSFPIVSK